MLVKEGERGVKRNEGFLDPEESPSLQMFGDPERAPRRGLM